MALSIDASYVAETINLLQSEPTVLHLDEMIERYTTIGYYCAEAQRIADDAETTLGVEEANVILRERDAQPKTPMVVLEAQATVQTATFAQDRNRKRANAKKLLNLYSAIEQNINAIKFLNRGTGL